MASEREYPDLWVTICRRARLSPTASVDRVRAAYGDAAGRGSFQRIQEGVDPRFSTLRSLADQLGMPISVFLADGAESHLPPQPLSAEVTSRLAQLDPVQVRLVENGIRGMLDLPPLPPAPTQVDQPQDPATAPAISASEVAAIAEAKRREWANVIARRRARAAGKKTGKGGSR